MNAKRSLNDEIEGEFRARGLMADQRSNKKMGRPKKHATADGEALRNDVNSEELRAYIERIERVNGEIADLTSDRGEIFKEIKAAGYDAATVRAIVKRRAMDPEKRVTMEELLDRYMSALGDFASSPLGQAGADRMREEARAG
jgi:uncharacterized protein (UPF0335 family)